MKPLRQDFVERLRARLRTVRAHRAATDYLCLMPQPGGLACAITRREGAGLRLVRCEWLPGEAATAWPRNAGAPQDAGIVLPFADYRLLIVEAPQVPADELPQAVRWLAVSQLPQEAAEDLGLDMIPLDNERAGGGRELLVAVAHNERLRQLAALAQGSALRPRAIDIPELAQRNLASLWESGQRHFALLSLTPAGGLLTVTRDGALCFQRAFELDWDRLGGDDALRAQLPVERLTLELQRSLDFLERNHAAWQIDTVHVAPTLPAARLDQIAAGLNTKLQPLPLGERLAGAEDLSPELLAHTWFALGGALRPHLPRPDLPQLNLLSADVLPSRPAYPARRLAGALAGIALLGMPPSAWFWWQAEQARQRHDAVLAEYDALNAQVEALELQRQLAGDGARAATPDPVQQRLLARLKALDRPPRLAQRLADLSQASMPGVWLREIVLTPDGFQLEGRCLDAQSLPAYLQRLAAQAGFAGAAVARLSLQPVPDEAGIAFLIDAGAARP